MKPTKEQIEEYIKCAHADLGPLSMEPWVEWCDNLLRSAVDAKPIAWMLRYDSGLVEFSEKEPPVAMSDLRVTPLYAA